MHYSSRIYLSGYCYPLLDSAHMFKNFFQLIAPCRNKEPLTIASYMKTSPFNFL